MNLKHFVFLLGSCLLLASSPAFADGIDAGKSITIGSGNKTVFEFTDPDCPFCRKASKYFEGRNDVTRHVFFYPLPRHPKAKDKAQYILSQDDRDRGAAYREVMSGKMDTVQTFVTTSQGVKLQKEQFDIAKKMKIDSTPTFIINGRIIVGFDLKKIEEALGPKP
jgi:thiol:disulfide interchange protein DsbC